MNAHRRDGRRDGPGSVAERLLDAEPLRAPALAAVIKQLDLAPGSRGVDVGCGLGLQARLLVHEVGGETAVCGVDRDSALVAIGARLIGQARVADRVQLCCGDALHLPFSPATFDWAWSADCVGYPAGDLEAALGEMVRVTKPGGRVVVVGWASQQVLPGYPHLEARLDAACSAYAPHFAGVPPEHHFQRGLGAFHAVGLHDVGVRTVAHDVAAPLAPEIRRALGSLLDMLWTAPTGEDGATEWAEFARLGEPSSPDYILDVPGYHAWFAYTVFTGTIPPRR